MDEKLTTPMTADQVLSYYHAFSPALKSLEAGSLTTSTLHAAATIACLEVLELRPCSEPSLLRYAQWHWLYHASQAGANDTTGLQDALKAFLAPSAAFKQWSSDITTGAAGLEDNELEWQIAGTASQIQLDVKASVADFPSPLLAICQWDLHSVVGDALTGLDVRALNSMHNCRGETPLCLAVKSGNKDMVKQLLAAGADANAAPRIVRPLDFATAKRDLSIATILLEAGASVHAKGRHGLTALQTAAKYGSVDIAAMLLARGADVNVDTFHEGTALQLASAKGFQGLVRLLLEQGARVNTMNQDENALVRAARGGHTQVVGMLLDAHEKPYSPEKVPLLSKALFVAVDSRHLGTKKMLIARGADVNSAWNKKVGTALVAAALNGDHKMMGMLIARGADVNHFSEPYMTALAAIAKRRYWDLHTAKLLLTSGAKLNEGGLGDAIRALDSRWDTNGRMRAMFEGYRQSEAIHARL